MQLLLISLIWFSSFQNRKWETDFQKATELATAEHKMILLNFSGSDWCVPCINLKKDIFNASPFLEYANEKLILLNADFPRLKKNRLSKEQQERNEKLADRYNKAGSFPFTLLLDSEGNILTTWDGLPGGDAASFVNKIKVFNSAKY